MVMLWISPHLIKPIPRVNIRDELWMLWMLWCRCAHILHYLASLADAYCWSLWQGSKCLFMGVLTLTVCNKSPFEQCVGKVILKQHQAESLTFAGTEAVANLNSSCWCCCCSLGSTPVHCGISNCVQRVRTQFIQCFVLRTCLDRNFDGWRGDPSLFKVQHWTNPSCSLLVASSRALLAIAQHIVCVCVCQN